MFNCSLLSWRDPKYPHLTLRSVSLCLCTFRPLCISTCAPLHSTPFSLPLQFPFSPSAPLSAENLFLSTWQLHVEIARGNCTWQLGTCDCISLPLHLANVNYATLHMSTLHLRLYANAPPLCTFAALRLCRYTFVRLCTLASRRCDSAPQSLSTSASVSKCASELIGI
jgi:hypothetical protein